jgi:hypothetical protein
MVYILDEGSTYRQLLPLYLVVFFSFSETLFCARFDINRVNRPINCWGIYRSSGCPSPYQDFETRLALSVELLLVAQTC